MAPWTWLHYHDNNTDIQFYRTFSKYTQANLQPLSLQSQVSVVYLMVIFYFLSPTDFFSKINFFENSVRKTTRVPNSLDPDQVRTFVGLHLGPGCFKQLLTDDTSLKMCGKILGGLSSQNLASGVVVCMCGCVYGGRPG